MSSSALALVVLSFFDRFRKKTTTLGSEMADRSGGSDTNESDDVLALKAAAAPKVYEPKAEAARALLACTLAWRLLMAVVGEGEEMEG